MKAIVIQQHGGPEELRLGEAEQPSASSGEILIRIEAAGVNYIDTYHRTGLYPADPPFTPGMEGAGVVEAIGPDVEGFELGDRVAYGMSRGSYAEFAAVPAWQVVSIPDSVDYPTAAAAMLQGMTAHYLTHSTYPGTTTTVQEGIWRPIVGAVPITAPWCRRFGTISSGPRGRREF